MWFYQASWWCKFAPVNSFKADVSNVSPSLERMEELWVVCDYMQKMELRYWWEHVIKESTNELVEWKLLVDIVGIKSAYLKTKLFFSRVLRLSEMPRCMERPRIAICCLEWLGRLKLTSDLFGCVLFIPFYVATVLELFTKSSSCLTCLYIYIYIFFFSLFILMK